MLSPEEQLGRFGCVEGLCVHVSGSENSYISQNALEQQESRPCSLVSPCLSLAGSKKGRDREGWRYRSIILQVFPGTLSPGEL